MALGRCIFELWRWTITYEKSPGLDATAAVPCLEGLWSDESDHRRIRLEQSLSESKHALPATKTVACNNNDKQVNHKESVGKQTDKKANVWKRLFVKSSLSEKRPDTNTTNNKQAEERRSFAGQQMEHTKTTDQQLAYQSPLS